MKNKPAICLVPALLLALSAPVYGQVDSDKTTTRSRMKDAIHSVDHQKTDTWLEAKLATTILLNRHLSIFEIDTAVKNKVAILTGTVSSDIDKDLAGELAKSIDGITAVQNRIAVDESKARTDKRADSSAQNRSFGQRIDDLTTTAAIKSKLIANSNVSAMAVNIDTVYGKVVLSGTVESAEKKALIEQIAKNSQGVLDVDSNLQIKAESQR